MTQFNLVRENQRSDSQWTERRYPIGIRRTNHRQELKIFQFAIKVPVQ